ncbi:MAG: methyl-accepting chemotaxis protein [Oscillospiraceae bacterium]
MKNLKIAQKIIVGFSSVLLLLLLIAVTAITSSAQTGANISEVDVYSALQSNANELMHILNETRITAGVLYETQSEQAYADATKQLMYCDLRLKKLYEYIDAHPQLLRFRENIEAYDALYSQWSSALIGIADQYHLGAPLSATDLQTFRQQSEEWHKTNLLAHEILSNTITDIAEASNKEMRITKKFNFVTLWIVVAVCAVSLLVAAIMALILMRSITIPLGNMRDVLHQIGTSGNLQISQERQQQLLEVAEGKDETSQCTKALLVLLDRLYRIDETLAHVANGNLTVSMDLQSEQDTMGLAVQKMLYNLNEKFGSIARSTVWVNQKAAELSQGSHHLAEGSRRQSESVENLSLSVRRVTEKSEQSAALAQQALDLVSNIQDNAKTGREKMNQMMQAAQAINASSQSIGKVIKVIDDIASQTNLLALNASVEAARAGQHGKGFAVVAEEVRNLAAKSAEAAKDTGALIDDTMQKAALGASIAETTSTSLEEIVAGVEESNAIIRDIAALSREQEEDIQGIMSDVAHVESIVEQNNSIAARSANAAGEISSQSNYQMEMVQQFRLRQSVMQERKEGMRL